MYHGGLDANERASIRGLYVKIQQCCEAARKVQMAESIERQDTCLLVCFVQ